MFQEGFFLPLETYAIIVIPLVIPVGENTSSSYPQSLQKMIGEVSAFLCNLYPNLLVFLRSSYFAQIETCKKKWFLEGTPFTKVWATWMFFQFWFPSLLISPLLSTQMFLVVWEIKSYLPEYSQHLVCWPYCRCSVKIFWIERNLTFYVLLTSLHLNSNSVCLYPVLYLGAHLSHTKYLRYFICRGPILNYYT